MKVSFNILSFLIVFSTSLSLRGVPPLLSPEEIWTIAACYKTLPCKDGQLRHLAPLTKDIKTPIISSLRKTIQEKGGEENSQNLALSQLLRSLQDETTSAFDVFKHFLDFSASISTWTKGDEELLLLFRTVPEMEELSFDSQLITPQNSVIKMLDLLLAHEDALC